MAPRNSTQPRRALVLSDEPLTAALLALLLELESYSPVFAAPGERPEDAVSRLRPLLIVLADFEMSGARSDIFLARVAKSRIGIAFFAGGSRSAELRVWARDRGVPWVELPADVSDLRRVLEDAESAWSDRRTGGERRPRTEVRDDGSILFMDASGRRWSVFDRRGSDRRITTDREPGDYRSFVAEDGEERHVALSGREFDDDSPAALERQLARATPL